MLLLLLLWLVLLLLLFFWFLFVFLFLFLVSCFACLVIARLPSPAWTPGGVSFCVLPLPLPRASYMYLQVQPCCVRVTGCSLWMPADEGPPPSAGPDWSDAFPA